MWEGLNKYRVFLHEEWDPRDLLVVQTLGAGAAKALVWLRAWINGCDKLGSKLIRDRNEFSKDLYV